MGSKYIHRAWIEQFIPVDTEVVLDAFGGSQSIAYLMKQLGKTTYTNDFLNFNYQIGKALIENAGELLTKEDIDILFSQNHNPSEYNLMEGLFSNLFFCPEEAALLDSSSLAVFIHLSILKPLDVSAKLLFFSNIKHFIPYFLCLYIRYNE